MEPKLFIDLARHIVEQGATRPSQVSLRRAISTAYYALFHALAQNGADLLVGRTARSSPAWQRVYRGLEHGRAREACDNTLAMSRFPAAIQDFGEVFVLMQFQRRRADYDPHAHFLKSSVTYDINTAEQAIKNFAAVGDNLRRDFSVHVLFKSRRP